MPGEMGRTPRENKIIQLFLNHPRILPMCVVKFHFCDVTGVSIECRVPGHFGVANHDCFESNTEEMAGKRLPEVKEGE